MSSQDKEHMKRLYILELKTNILANILSERTSLASPFSGIVSRNLIETLIWLVLVKPDNETIASNLAFWYCKGSDFPEECEEEVKKRILEVLNTNDIEKLKKMYEETTRALSRRRIIPA